MLAATHRDTDMHMILIGQYDSPFVRRVGIALMLYGLPFHHQPWSTFGDADQIRPYNPLHRVPTLVLGDGDVLIETLAILDYIDSLVPDDRRLAPMTEPQRHRVLKIAALAGGTADKAVSLFYEFRLHTQVSDVWASRCTTQILAALECLEADLCSRTTRHWFGERITHADVAVATTMRFLGEAHPQLIGKTNLPGLRAHAERMEALPAFQAISQPFVAPA